MKKFGFTLAEVLITLAVIGVIAAITLPSLMNDIGFRGIEKQTAKFYSTMINALNIIKADAQVDDLSDVTLTPELIASNLKVSERCSINDCAPQKYGFLDASKGKKSPALLFMGIEGKNVEENSPAVEANGDTALYVLEDGSTVYISDPKTFNTLGEKQTVFTDIQPLTIYFDVNGKKAPNVLGRDLWITSISDDGTLVDTKVTSQTKKMALGKPVVTSETKHNLTKDSCNLKDTSSCFDYFRKNGFKFDY